MKKSILLFVLISAYGMSLFAQGYKKIYYKNISVENELVKIETDDGASTEKYTRVRVRITNKTNDYILYKPEESVFKVSGTESKPNEKWLLLRPKETDSKVIDAKGTQFMVNDYSLLIEGLYKIAANSKPESAPDFKLPPSQNDFNAGGFAVNIIKFKKETDRTDAKFKCTYSGDKIGIFEPNKIAVRMPDGKEFANYHSDRKPQLFIKNESDDFTATWKDIPIQSGDMQKVEMNILWRDAFKEVSPEKVKTLTIEIKIDEELTKAKNK